MFLDCFSRSLLFIQFFVFVFVILDELLQKGFVKKKIILV
jgi:hypothetical protein